MIVEMRRALSILLIAFFSLGPLTAWSGADDDSRLPACCRRHGRHHCAMNSEMAALAQAASGSTPIFTAPAHCPYFPGYLQRSISSIFGPAASPAALPIPPSRSLSIAALRLAIPLQPIRAHAGRGPPSLI
jgi:hypothetical protein